MENSKFVLINSLPLDIISGGNIYNQNLCRAFLEKGIAIDYIFSQKIVETIMQLDDDTIILLDSFCLNEKVDWNAFISKKIIILLHLAPSADDQNNIEKMLEINETEKIVFANFPIISAGKKAIDDVEEKYDIKVSKFEIVPPAIVSSWQKKSQYNLLPKKILVVGTITKRKGYQRLIETLVLLKENNWKCDCYGAISDGNLMKVLQTLLENHQLQDRVRFCGTVNNEAMNLLQKEYDLLLQLSDEENNSVVLMEAIATGLPFICTPTGNFNYFVEHHCGLVLSSFDPKAIAKEIKPIMTNSIEYDVLINSLKNVSTETWHDNIDCILTFTRKLW